MANEFVCSYCKGDGTRCNCVIERRGNWSPPTHEELRQKQIEKNELELLKLTEEMRCFPPKPKAKENPHTMTNQENKDWVPCTCPKGGMDDNGKVCEKCGGTEWLPTPTSPSQEEWIADFVNSWTSTPCRGEVGEEVKFLIERISRLLTTQAKQIREEIAEYVANYTADLCENSQQFKNDVINHVCKIIPQEQTELQE